MASLSGAQKLSPVDVLMVGIGEYTTGYVHGSESDSDKGAGVVGLVMMDLRTKGEVGTIGMVGTSGDKYEGILAHMEKKIVKAYPASGMKVQPMKVRYDI